MASSHSTPNPYSQPRPPQPNEEEAQDHTMTDADADAPPPPTTVAAPPTPPYSAPFENALMDLILQPPDSTTTSSSSALITAGTQILDDTNPKPEPGFKGPSIHVRDIDPLSLPHVEAGELPLGLGDPRRRFRTQVAGVRVTHPGGSFGGGVGAYGVHPLFPGSDGESSGAGAGVGVGIGSEGGRADAAALLADTRAFIAEKDVKTGLGLRRAIRAEQQVLLRRVRERMERRREAVEENERVEREVKKLEDQRGMERRLEQRVRERRAGRKGG
ncbi:hypothetical protein LTS18_004782 [Coniosporium uncinatum]|uniref:Uncharacterized protein n=1 Tax=Coniosporium uncinatum TaxID=93489 RepID=A0ACC3DS70_9PEZI|nr:hypothetical protein LTS18_004782 [Coniosporium uncinatum]